MQRSTAKTVRGGLAAVFLGVALLAAGPASAAEPTIAVGEISPPTELDAADVRASAEREILTLDAEQLKGKGKLVVALALVRSTVNNAVRFTVNAMVRDAKTGNMLAIIEGGAHAEGALSTSLARQVADAAVRNAISRIPTALLARR